MCPLPVHGVHIATSMVALGLGLGLGLLSPAPCKTGVSVPVSDLKSDVIELDRNAKTEVASPACSGLRQELVALGAQMTAIEARLAVLEAGATDHASSKQRETIGRKNQTTSSAEDQLALLEEQFDVEQVDRAWSSSQERLMVQSLQSPAFGGSVLASAECRRSLCRAEISHRDAAAQEELMNELPRLPPWNTQDWIETVRYPDGSVTSVIYVGRANSF